MDGGGYSLILLDFCIIISSLEVGLLICGIYQEDILLFVSDII